jgi:hypothetical protein
MSTNPSESKLPTSEELEAEITAFSKERTECEAKARELLLQEDPSKGIFFPQEIFQLKQDKLRLETEILFRKNKLARMRFEQ